MRGRVRSVVEDVVEDVLENVFDGRCIRECIGECKEYVRRRVEGCPSWRLDSLQRSDDIHFEQGHSTRVVERQGRQHRPAVLLGLGVSLDSALHQRWY